MRAAQCQKCRWRLSFVNLQATKDINNALAMTVGDMILAAAHKRQALTCRLLKCSSSRRSRKPTRLPHTWRHSSNESHAHQALWISAVPEAQC